VVAQEVGPSCMSYHYPLPWIASLELPSKEIIQVRKNLLGKKIKN
jgi:hypothetical protein